MLDVPGKLSQRLTDMFGSLMFLLYLPVSVFYVSLFSLPSDSAHEIMKQQILLLPKQHPLLLLSCAALIWGLDVAFAICLVLTGIRYIRARTLGKFPHYLGLGLGILGLFTPMTIFGGLYWFCYYRWHSLSVLADVPRGRRLVIGLAWVMGLLILGAGATWLVTTYSYDKLSQ